MGAERAEFSILRDGKGRYMKGTAPPGNRKGSRSIAAVLRKRYAQGGEKEGTVEKLVERLEDIALGHTEARVRDQMDATITLLKMYQGSALFTHAGPDALEEQQGEVMLRPRRVLASCDEVDRQAAAMAKALGVEPEKLAETVEAALDFVDAAKDGATAEEATDDDA